MALHSDCTRTLTFENVCLLCQLSEGLSVEEVSSRATELFRPFLELAERGGGGGDKVNAADEFATAKAFVCTPDPEAGGEVRKPEILDYSKP